MVPQIKHNSSKPMKKLNERSFIYLLHTYTCSDLFEIFCNAKQSNSRNEFQSSRVNW